MALEIWKLRVRMLGHSGGFRAKVALKTVVRHVPKLVARVVGDPLNRRMSCCLTQLSYPLPHSRSHGNPHCDLVVNRKAEDQSAALGGRNRNQLKRTVAVIRARCILGFGPSFRTDQSLYGLAVPHAHTLLRRTQLPKAVVFRITRPELDE